MKAIISFVAGVMLWGMAMSGMAQTERKFIREGNDFFEKQDFEKAEVEYRKASDKRAESFEAAFNMADALYKQKKYEEALSQFTALAKKETDKERLGEIYHNIGNTLLAMQKTDESIEAYKESLRNRPASEPTKYNLEFARQNNSRSKIKTSRIRIRIRTKTKTRTRIKRTRTKRTRIRIREKTRIRRTSRSKIKISKIRIKKTSKVSSRSSLRKFPKRMLSGC